MINRIENKIIDRLDFISIWKIAKLFDCSLSDASEIIQNYLNKTKLIAGATLNLSESKGITTLGAVQEITGDLIANKCDLSDLGDLKYIDGLCEVMWTNITSLSKLNYCSELMLAFNGLIDLGRLEAVDGNVYIENENKLNGLGKLKSIDGDLKIINTKNLSSLGRLTYVSGDVVLSNTNMITLSNLKSIGGSLDIRNSSVGDINNLEELGGFIIMKKNQFNVKKADISIVPIGMLSNIYNIPRGLSYTKIKKYKKLTDINIIMEDDIDDGK